MDSQGPVSLSISRDLPKFMPQFAMGMPSRHLILWHPLLLLPSVFTSIGIFSSESAVHIRRLKYWSFRFSISLSNESSVLSSLMTDWFNLAVQRTLRSLLQHCSSKTSIFWCSVFFTVQLSQPYVTTGETIALAVWTFVSRGMSLLLNTLSRFVITFLPRNKHLILWLQSPSAVILEPEKMKSITTSTLSPFYLPWSKRARCHDLSFCNI